VSTKEKAVAGTRSKEAARKLEITMIKLEGGKRISVQLFNMRERFYGKS